MRPYQYWILTAGAGLALLLAVANMGLFQANRSAQAEVAGRAQYLQQTAELQGLYRQLAQSLAELAVRQDDPALRDLLASEGLTLNAPAAGAAAP